MKRCTMVSFLTSKQHFYKLQLCINPSAWCFHNVDGLLMNPDLCVYFCVESKFQNKLREIRNEKLQDCYNIDNNSKTNAQIIGIELMDLLPSLNANLICILLTGLKMHWDVIVRCSVYEKIVIRFSQMVEHLTVEDTY